MIEKLSCWLILPFLFSLAACSPAGNYYVWDGRLTVEKMSEFRGKLKERPDITGIEFRSSLGAANSLKIIIEELESLIRTHKLSTYVRGTCASACATAFLLGTTRTMNQSSFFGIPSMLMLHPVTALGERNSGYTDVLNRKIVAASDGKFPLDLLDRMYEVTGASTGGIYIFGVPQKTSRGSAYVLLCLGEGKLVFSECEPIPKYTPESLGIRVEK